VFFNDRDAADHEQVIAWAARQPWCDGQVVLYGISYYGCAQLEVAVRKPPDLKGFVCVEVCTDYFRHIVAFGGSPALYFLSLWMGANFTRTIVKLKMRPLLRALVSHVLNSRLKAFWWPRMQKRLPAIMSALARKTPVRPVREMWANWMFDGKTRATNLIPSGSHARLERIDVPFVTVQNLGMFNLHQFGSYELFQKASTPKDRKWMILGKPSYELPTYEWQLEALAFFDHITRGTANGYAAQPSVRYWLDGRNEYVGAHDFPVPDGERVRFYPASAGPDGVIHTLATEAAAAGSNRWAAAPLGAPFIGGMDEVINQTLTYDFVVSEEIEFSGPVRVNLRFSCNEIDSHVVARLGRVDTDDGYHLLSLGAISPARRKIDEARSTQVEIAIDIDEPEALEPGVPVILRFSLTPGPTRLKRGERLRLEIASRTDLLKSDVAHDHAHFNLEVPPYFSRNTIHYGPETYIELYRRRDVAH
ncbi:MAG TPA: CocE/NonD family hydrolase, partial [Pararhizobium sp.]|nr:CocE/NonD family hydrolase [Pararhizobium sp.]